MGASSSQPLIPLTPFNPPLGIHTSYCAPHPVTLVLKEKAFSFSGDDFNIKDAANGMDVVRCQGQALSFRDKKVITDTSNRVLFTIKNKLLSVLSTYTGEDPSGRLLFTVKSKFSIGGAKMTAHFINASNGRAIELELRGSFWEGSAAITLDGRPVAQISRQFLTSREIFTSKQTYYVTVAPGVDLALIAAIAICLDELTTEG
ncbi:Tubby C-terminal-like domain [Phaffia rhodozyma]|uniref:Tubby C-terminal-like domain n=1 Tax=Phaffia rhodozyma TaxID=264483 RepID=A0A0F7SEX0_PHARH|nr:Tubby C-terminal-like domain [Phaffia rhodozyma]